MRPEVPGTASEENKFNRDARESGGSRGGGRGESTACTPNPVLQTLRWEQTQEWESQVQGGRSEPPVHKQ